MVSTASVFRVSRLFKSLRKESTNKRYQIASDRKSHGVKSGNHVIIRAGTSFLFISQSCGQILSNPKTSVR